MQKHELAYITEDASHDAAIELINDEAFGPARFTRAAQRIREQGPHDRALSFVCLDDGALVGSVRMTPVLAGSVNGHMLGPLVVRPGYKSYGMGRKLLEMAVEAARARGSEAVILVGDPPYYTRFGFEPVAYGALHFPGPVDPARVLAVPMTPDTHARMKGVIAWRKDEAAKFPCRSAA